MKPRPLLCTALALCASLVAAKEPDFLTPNLNRLTPPKYGPWEVYVTEPDFESAIFNIKHMTNDKTKLFPGYYIFSVTEHGGPGPWGPQIRDNNGDLVFWGRNFMKGRQDPHFCDFKGQPYHICANEIVFLPGRVSGIRRIYDNTYTDVSGGGYFRAPNDKLVEPNDHEFRMLPGGKTFMQPVYQPTIMDLRQYGGPQKGYVHDGCFQEIDVYTKKMLFSWCYLDHLSIEETYIYLNVEGNTINSTSLIAGAGTEHNGWDFIHENAVDKNEEGDYLVSARHMNQIIKVAGKHNKYGLEPGEVVWLLNGKHSTIELNFTFSRQHHSSFVKTTENTTVISLFNNAWEGRNDPSADFSTAQVIEVDEVNKRATLLREFKHPEHKLAAAQGAVYVLPNDNVFVDWGHLKQLSEYGPDNELLMHAHVCEVGSMDVYRAFKGPWVGRPKWSPKLIAYSQGCTHGIGSPLLAWVSWNGATDVVSWSFHVKTSSHSEAPWIPAGTYEKTGFETKVDLLGSGMLQYLPFARWIRVEALNATGDVIGSQETETFVPNKRLENDCNAHGCHHPPRFIYKAKDSRVAHCTESDAPALIWMFLLLIGIESIDYLSRYGWMSRSKTV